MKKTYVPAELNLVMFSDVIITSGDDNIPLPDVTP